MGIKIICDNKKARFEYQIGDVFEAGLVLKGTEVKSLREGHANLGDAYGMVKNGEVFLVHCHISPYQQSHYDSHEPMRIRKLLLHKAEIKKLIGKTTQKGLTLVPLKLFFKDGKAKVDIALATHKKNVDKRDTIKKRDTDRQIQRAMRRK